jgi:hypothetical protein
MEMKIEMRVEAKREYDGVADAPKIHAMVLFLSCSPLTSHFSPLTSL